jgi:membrane protease subunit HflK
MRRLLLPTALLAIAVVLAGSGVCLVAPGEVVVVRRMGKLVEPAWGPGLHWRYPFGIDRIDRVKALEVRQLTIGLAGSASTDFEPSTGEFVTGDLNLLRIQATIQYRVSSAVDYILRVEQVEPLLSHLAEAALTRAVASCNVDGIMRFERRAIAQDVERDLQSTSALCRLGIAVLGVSLTDARPPDEVAADFVAAQSAESERDRRINEARSYAETTATMARSEAQTSLQAAAAAAQRRTLTASAQAEQFIALLAEAQRARSLTIRRIYIDSLRDLLDQVKGKIVLPPGDSVDLTVLGIQDQPDQ